jgi:hypothetical protein
MTILLKLLSTVYNKVNLADYMVENFFLAFTSGHISQQKTWFDKQLMVAIGSEIYFCHAQSTALGYPIPKTL